MLHSHRHGPARPTNRARFDVGQIFRDHGDHFRRTHRLSDVQAKALHAIASCRTDVLGGHVDVCADCGHSRPSYNSCRNRHCPKCQGLAQAEWLERRRDRILPIPHFHVVFTLPSELRALSRLNPRLFYDLLFDCGAQSLLELARSRLGVQLGLTAVLHTWTRELLYHPHPRQGVPYRCRLRRKITSHLHCVVTAGGLDEDDQWKSSGSRFLLSVKALGRLFRGKLLDALRKLHAAGKLDLTGPCATLADPGQFKRLMRKLYSMDWVVYAKRPFAGADHVYQYLGQYTHRVGIANSRLLHVDATSVRFRSRGKKHVTVTPDQFIGRLLRHVLPFRFVKIRHYGLLAAGNVNTRLQTARSRIAGTAPPMPSPSSPPTVTAKPTWRDRVIALTGADPMLCPACGGLFVRHPLNRGDAITEAHDTS